MTDAKQDRIVERTEVCAASSARRIAAMLDLDPDMTSELTHLPRGWHFFLISGETRRSTLRSDGFPGLGVEMPDVGLPRLLLGGRSVAYDGDIPIGATVHRRSFTKSVTSKSTPSGPMAVALIEHQLRVAGASAAAIVETQTYLMLPAAKHQPADEKAGSPIAGGMRQVIVPDETLLFQYSALGFNSHKIHLDRAYAHDVEGLPDLVVNGGLATLLMTEFLRTGIGATPAAVKTRHIAPLFCGRPVTITATRRAAGWQLSAFNDQGVEAVTMEADLA